MRSACRHVLSIVQIDDVVPEPPAAALELRRRPKSRADCGTNRPPRRPARSLRFARALRAYAARSRPNRSRRGGSRPSFSTRASSATNGGCTSRRLWWRFFGHGSGKNRFTASKQASGNECGTTSAASRAMTRTLSVAPARAAAADARCRARALRRRGSRRREIVQRFVTSASPSPKPMSRRTRRRRGRRSRPKSRRSLPG